MSKDLGAPLTRRDDGENGGDARSVSAADGAVSLALDGGKIESIMGGMVLGEMECLVALGDDGTGWVIAKSDTIRERDILIESSTDDNGFNSSWDRGLTVGLYLVTIEPWATKDYDGDYDCGIDVIEVRPLWTVPPPDLTPSASTDDATAQNSKDATRHTARLHTPATQDT